MIIPARVSRTRAHAGQESAPICGAGMDMFCCSSPAIGPDRSRHDTPLSTFHAWNRLLDPQFPIHGALAVADSGEAIGLVHWLTHAATWSATPYTYLEDLFVSAGARGSGAGRALIAHVSEWAREHGSPKVYWLTHETNSTARALYDRVTDRSGFLHYEIELDA